MLVPGSARQAFERTECCSRPVDAGCRTSALQRRRYGALQSVYFGGLVGPLGIDKQQVSTDRWLSLVGRLVVR